MNTNISMIIVALAVYLAACSSPNSKKTTLLGEISGYDSQIVLVKSGSELKGEFQYLILDKAPIPVKGFLTNTNLVLEEFNEKSGSVTGIFDGDFDGEVFHGYWTGSRQKKRVPFRFEVAAYKKGESREAPPNEQVQEISYQVTKDEDGTFIKKLVAKMNGQNYVLIKESHESCLMVEEIRDFDGDSYKDVLIRDVYGCGGTCCPFTGFYFISWQIGEGFKESQEFGNAGEVSIEKEGGVWSVYMESAGELTPRGYTWIHERYILQDGNAIQVSRETHDKQLDALDEIVSTDFENRGSSLEKRIYYDIDGDGEKDVLIGEVWGTMNNIKWSIRFSNGKVYQNEHSYRRIGILPSKTKGKHDLVGGMEDVLRWNGVKYQVSQ